MDEAITLEGLPEVLGGDYSDWASLMEPHFEWRDAASALIAPEDRPVPKRIVEVWWSFHGVEKATEDGSELSLYAVVEFTDGRWGYVEAWNRLGLPGRRGLARV